MTASDPEILVTPPDREFIRKSHLDLWVHQNNLLWSRFNLLYIIQGAFFVTASTLKTHAILMGIALFMTLYLTGWLYSTVDQDRQLRNHHADILRKDYGFDPLPAKLATTPGLAATTLEIVFQWSVFGPFAACDLAVALYWLAQ